MSDDDAPITGSKSWQLAERAYQLEHGPMSDLSDEIERLRSENIKLLAALKLCDRYFMSCASAWAANEGRLMDDEGRAIAQAPELDEMAEEAANAVAAIIR